MRVEELRVFGIYMPAPLVWAIIAMIVVYLIRGWLHRLPLYALLWQPALLDLAAFVLLWWGIARVADMHLLFAGVT
jgi:protein AaeX